MSFITEIYKFPVKTLPGTLRGYTSADPIRVPPWELSTWLSCSYLFRESDIIFAGSCAALARVRSILRTVPGIFAGAFGALVAPRPIRAISFRGRRFTVGWACVASGKIVVCLLQQVYLGRTYCTSWNRSIENAFYSGEDTNFYPPLCDSLLSKY